MQELDLLDETFVKNQSYHYHMSIQTGLNGLSFCILDLQNLKYVGLRNYNFENIKDEHEIAAYFLTRYQDDDLLKLRYKSVSHQFIGDNVTLVPSEYFEENIIKDYYSLNFGNAEGKAILQNSINSNKVYTIFGYPQLLHKALTDCYPQIKLYHNASPIIDNLAKAAVNTVRPACYIYLYKGQVSIGLIENKAFQYFNVFKVSSNADIIYYILNVLNQYNCNIKNTDLYISSDIESHDEIFEEFNTYFTHFNFISPSNQFTYSYLFDELYLTRYVNLFNLALCE